MKIGVCSEVESIAVQEGVTEVIKVCEDLKDNRVKMKEYAYTPKSGSNKRFVILDIVFEKKDEQEEDNCSIENDIVLAKEKQLLEPKKSKAASA